MFFAILILGVISGISEAVVCKNNTDCGTGECCYIQPEFMVVSKRQALLPHLHQHHDTGVCEKYRQMGDHCGVFEIMNGHCGCGYGTHCRWVPEPTTTKSPIIRKMLPYHDGPGAYKCA
ncbi:uncharacterized protein LOC132733800 [Ruditapes philippinarum]|uniref:uncharacterized protein LOC132733800 n=1 Tax=Ruditapes philippinarum TaxID=129788 RepID=UPI00295C2697|nr:uncharacterized protein LOC132733800 [Ruditapes philippinarum]